MLSQAPAKLVAGVRCLRVLSNVLHRKSQNHAIHSSSRILFSSFDKDLPVPKDMTPVDKLYAADTDVLHEQLKKTKTIGRLLELVSMHIDVMNNNHIVTCFNVITDVVKTGQAGLIEYQDVRNNEVFQSLCSQTMTRMRYFEPQDVINVLKTLTKLNVHSNTYIMQALHKMLCSQINELNLNQLVFLDFLLSRQDHTPLVDSLRLALPLVLQIQIDQQLDSDNFQQVIDCLSIACRAKLKIATIEKIILCLQKKIAGVTAHQASVIIFSLFSLNVPANGYEELVKASFEIVTQNINDVPRSNLLSLSRMCLKHSFYYRSFLMRLSHRVAAEHWNFEECYELIPRLHKLNFFSPEVLDILTMNICSNSTPVQCEDKFCILTLSECLAFADYIPIKLKEALDVISSAVDKAEKLYKTAPSLYLKMVTCWAMVGYFPEQYIKKVMSEKFLYSAWSLSNKNGRSLEFENNLCYLSWALEVYNRANQFSLPKNYMNKTYHAVLQKKRKTHKYPLTKFLEIGLGGPQFFQTGIVTHNGYIIDHVLCMRDGNYPVALRDEKNTSQPGEQIIHLQDIRVIDNAKMIAVLVVAPNDYATDPEILKTYVALKMKNLSQMSLTPVVIKYQTWYNLPDREKIPFLMQEIKLAYSSENAALSSAPL